jgi:glucokinase
MAIIGLDIGGTKILGAFFNEQGVIIDREKSPSKAKKGFDSFLSQVYKVIETILERADSKVKGIGIGFPGTIDKNGAVIFAPNLPVENFDLAKHLEDKYDIPVYLGNDVNLGTYGEYSELDMPHANVIGLFPGTGLGGGIVIDGELYIGQGSAGELGHIVVQKNGVLCSCGNKGCLESYASKKGIIKFMKKEIKNGRETFLKKDIKKGILKSSRLKEAYDKKDELTLEAMNRFEEYLGMGIGIIMNIFNPDLILIGGGISEAFGEDLLKELKEHIKAYAMPGIFKNTEVKLSKLEDDAVVYGGYHLAKSKLKI